MAILILGATCSLGEAVVDKLLSMDIDVIAAEDSHYKRNSTLLEYSTANLYSEGDGYSISFDGSDANLVVGKDLIIHDLIPSRADKWLAPEIIRWANGEDMNSSPRYWLSVIDAANAIAHILRAEKKINRIDMCGRREWLAKDSKSEFEMLWQRTHQGTSGKFTAETLFGHEIAGMDAKPISEISGNRPDLAPLHDLLLDLTGDGWRPLVPFRTALMSLIAGLLV
ncbi:MAG: hypothetical protein HOE76_04395 [Euryarchaeota archaeon]|jgi:hypothetical protein|nr:hypothetical protein [Euryarchaeota archaeon]MBT4982284.1 hypothetical protein [Euryarchaeota archaeon]MBT5184222.1 hypothetical protein [Euryarchaeota archaeon]